MYSYREQLTEVRRIKIAEGERKTLDCPFCGGQKKFTIDRLASGQLLWNCFRASCEVRGSYQGERSLTAAKRYHDHGPEKVRSKPKLQIPEITTSLANVPHALEYLRSVNSIDAYESGLIRMRYAPREKRVLFYNKSLTGAVGRNLLGAGPKWITYGDTSEGIHVGKGKNAVLVEDAASACSISRIPDLAGVALLGTNLTSALRNALQIYVNIFILLDNDASSKAVKLIKKVRGSVFLRITDRDPKELGICEVKRVLRLEETNDAQHLSVKQINNK